MDPTIDRAKIHLTMNVDAQGNPSGGGGGGGGDATAANQVTLNTSIGATNESAAGSDSATSGLNGLIKRLLARFTTFLGVVGTASDAAWTSGDGTEIALLKRIATEAQSTANVNVANGQAEYETVAASQTDQILGATGASSDYLSGLLIVPATTSPGAVSIKDGSGGSAITVFTGGASSVTNLVPFFVPLGANATSTGWRVTTGTNVSVFAVGNFT